MNKAQKAQHEADLRLAVTESAKLPKTLKLSSKMVLIDTSKSNVDKVAEDAGMLSAGDFRELCYQLAKIARSANEHADEGKEDRAWVNAAMHLEAAANDLGKRQGD